MNAFLTDFTRKQDIWHTWVRGQAAATGISSARAVATTLLTARKADVDAPAATCEVARTASERLGLAPAVPGALGSRGGAGGHSARRTNL